MRMIDKAHETRLVFPEQQRVELEAFEPPALGAKDVAVRTLVSLMSTGTENIVFNHAFDSGTHWDEWVRYPFHPGYAAVGEVVEVGSEVTALAPGRRVALRFGHASLAVVPEARCYPVPNGMEPDEAVWFALAKIAYLGALAAEFSLGDSVLVIGAGPIGQMVVRWASAAGAKSVIAADTVESRLQLASEGGATETITGDVAANIERLKQAADGVLPRAVVDSTGNARVFESALRCARDRGRVVVLGDTGAPSEQRLTRDVITRGLTIVGAHDGHNTQEWNDQTISALFFHLARSGRFPLSHLTTHSFAPGQCVEAYHIANTRRGETMGILFDWR